MQVFGREMDRRTLALIVLGMLLLVALLLYLVHSGWFQVCHGGRMGPPHCHGTLFNYTPHVH